MKTRHLLFLAALAVSISLGCDVEVTDDPLDGLDADGVTSAETRPRSFTAGVFEVQMHNETPSQWFSPCLCALHHPGVDLFRDGRPATTGMATFSEDGFNAVFAEELRQQPWVYSVLECEAGLTPPGGDRVETIEGPTWARLTCAAMPVTTNDVLTVADAKPVPWSIGGMLSHSSVEWDLGSEQDDYSPDSIPLDSVVLDESGFPTVLSFFSRAFAPEGSLTAEGTMEVFDAFVGSADFPAEHYGWSGSASSWTITRIE